MDEKEQMIPEEFDLDDIMREFAGVTDEDLAQVDLSDLEGEKTPAEAPGEPQESAEEEATEEAAEEAAEETPEEAAEEAAPEAGQSVTSDTIRIGDLAGEMEKKPAPDLEITAVFKPITEEQARAAAQQEQETPAGEPEFEDPFGGYVPPEPIVFRPHSRLRELKRKLVAGPEKRYYQLSEVGLGKLQAAMVVTLLVFLLTAGATALYATGIVPADRIRLVIFIQVFGILVAALMGCYRLLSGVAAVLRGRFTLDSLLVISLLACLADGVLCLKELRLPCGAAFCLEMVMALWAEYHRRNTEMGQMDTMRKAVRLDAIVRTGEFYEGRAGLLQREGMVEEFMDTYNQTSGPEKVQSVYALAALAASIAIGVAAGVLHSYQLGIRFAAAALLAGVPATAFITLTRPAAVLERRLHNLGTVICGWQGVKALSRNAVYPLTHTDLFPGGTTKMNGVKFYGDRNPDQVVAYGAALIAADGGGLEPLFNQLLESRSGLHYEVDELRCYGGGGIGGVINEEPVLMGVRSFMQDMGVDMPEGTKVNQAVYMAIDGELCAVFALTYVRNKGAAAGLATLCGYRGLTPALVTGDFMLTESFLRSQFGVNTRRIAFPQRADRAELAARQPEEEAPALAMYTKEGLAAKAYAVTGARSLRTASILGLTVHMFGGIAGLAIMLALCLVGRQDLLTPANLLLYQMVWMVPGLLISEWTRVV